MFFKSLSKVEDIKKCAERNLDCKEIQPVNPKGNQS